MAGLAIMQNLASLNTNIASMEMARLSSCTAVAVFTLLLPSLVMKCQTRVHHIKRIRFADLEVTNEVLEGTFIIQLAPHFRPSL